MKQKYSCKAVQRKKQPTIALAGSPNAGKSTIFNYITGLKQHTGNWTGKTVENAYGYYYLDDKQYIMVDLPGTYSLMPRSNDEEAARDFICFGKPDAIVVVVDATMLERQLNLALQIIEVTNRVVLCVNLIDEANRKGIFVDTKKLSKCLSVPVVATNAKSGKGVKELLSAVDKVLTAENTKAIMIPQQQMIESQVSQIMNLTMSRWVSLKLLENDESTVAQIFEQEEYKKQKEELLFLGKKARLELENEGIDTESLRELLVSAYFDFSKKTVAECVSFTKTNNKEKERKIDRFLTSKFTGIPMMLVFLGLILWLTIVGANYPSELLSNLLFGVEEKLKAGLEFLNAPSWVIGVFVEGMYRTLAWVVSVMLPPMAIFFPLFTLLEDVGYLPRIAFNLDRCFCRACAHGKQALTTCMGFGCNAVGVSGCNIIDSPRERLIAILTNNFVPCNGRFPTIILLSGILIGSYANSVISMLVVLMVILLGICAMLFASKLLSKTLLKGYPSHFTLELPPYRKPKICSVIVRSVFDRTIYVLGRAVSVAAPAGMLIWLLANINIGGFSLMYYCADFLHPFARLFGLDGYILLAFLLAIPANEIFLPLLMMGYTALGSLTEISGLETIQFILMNHGWTFLTTLNVMIFMLMHFPCATTLLTIKKETKSIKWTLFSFVLPTVFGLCACLITTTVVNVLSLLGIL